MAEHPILFSAAMVKAILEGRKTQTRRLVNPPAWALPNPHRDQWGNWFWLHDDTRPNEEHLYAKTWPRSNVPIGSNPGPGCPYGQPGDELWVRETWARDWEVGENSRGEIPAAMFYRATDELPSGLRWNSPIFMPRWASRLQLVIRDVRVQRLQEIEEADARAEGVEVTVRENGALEPLRRLWDSINSKRAPWSSNPWVWAITFERKA